MGSVGFRRAAAVVAGAGVGALVRGVAGGGAGEVLGLAVGAAAVVCFDRWLGSLEPASVAARRAAIADALPLCLDLIAACADAGLPVSAVVPVLAESLGGPLGVELSAVHRLLALGASREQAWARLADPATGGPGVAAAVRAVLAAELRGTRLAATLAGLAADQRAAASARWVAAAHRAGVLAVLPLGLCFLPAFVLLGVLPVVASALSKLL